MHSSVENVFGLLWMMMSFGSMQWLFLGGGLGDVQRLCVVYGFGLDKMGYGKDLEVCVECPVSHEA